jgi:Family of unknown function (DUF5715)
MLRTAFINFVLIALSIGSTVASQPAAKAHAPAQTPALFHRSLSYTATSSVHSRGKTHRSSTPGSMHAGGRTARRTVRRRTGHRAAHTRQQTAQTIALRASRTATAASLRGSHQSLARQNDKTEDDNLERIEDEADLADRISRKLLVPVPTSSALTINTELAENHRYCRPWTAQFLTDLARVHAAQFHKPLEVSSAVRTVDYQKQLMETNGNAAAAEGDVVSPHVTGATIDIAKGNMTGQELAWMRGRLLPLQKAGKIDVEEEFQQACFHITVYKAYVPDDRVVVPSARPVVRAGQARQTRHTSRQGAEEQSSPSDSTVTEPVPAHEIATS